MTEQPSASSYPPPGSTVQRVTARVLPVNSENRVLLLHGWEPKHPERTFWFTIGGAVEEREDLRTAGARELAEETGIVIDPADLGETLGEQLNAFDWDGWHLEQSETYYAIRVDAEADLSGLDGLEQETIDRAGWLTPDELDADGTAANPGITAMMRRAIARVGTRT